MKMRYNKGLKNMLKMRDDIVELSDKVQGKIDKLVQNMAESVNVSVTFTEHADRFEEKAGRLLAHREKLANMFVEIQGELQKTLAIYTDLAHDRIAMRSASPRRTLRSPRQSRRAHSV
jgi:uncharacterized coiled-coil DUF342 family protein